MRAQTVHERDYISAHLHDDIRKLALSLKAKPSDWDVPYILRQIAGRQAIREKLPEWYANDDILYPEHLPLEQCSSELTAQYKSNLCDGHSLIDLTGGFGVDCLALAQGFEQAFYVERQEELCRLAKHNFTALARKHIQVIHGDAAEYLQNTSPVDCIYLDPARRDPYGKKTVAITDLEPDLSVLKDRLLEKATTVLVKLSPMLDISLALKSLPETRAVHVVSVENECKELLFLLQRDCLGEAQIHAINLSRKKTTQPLIFTRSEEENRTVAYTNSIQSYLYEPNASIMKAGGYKIITQHYPIEKLHQDSHLYTADVWLENFPGRYFCVQQVIPFNKKDLKEHLQDIAQANITVRNFPLSVDDIRKKLRIKPGGDTYLYATTLANKEKVLIRCYRPKP